MASAQVYRFQQRVFNLQSHHELASVRHCEAVSNYISQNHELMNSLMAHLKATDKNVKRTKRIAKSRTTNPQLAKSARFSGKSYAMQSQVEHLGTIHHSLPKQTDFINQCLPEELWNNFSIPANNDNHLACNSKEPIFPPPTYADPGLNCEPSIFDDCSWDNWPRDSESRSSNCVPQTRCQSLTLQQKHTACETPFIYNGAEAEQHWSCSNLSFGTKQQTLSHTSDYNLPDTQPLDSNWLKQSTSYDELGHLPPVNWNYHMFSDELLYGSRNSFSPKHSAHSLNRNSLPNQVFNYAEEFSSSNSCYESMGSSKNRVNPILASTYPTVGSNLHPYASTSFNPNECYLSYHLSDSNNNNGSSGNSSTSNYPICPANANTLHL
ncbi:hypothetical protein KSF78_0005714 [Schistosoma japonicum]|nr:hypothetical protein KSF78_0005714 [Schistosoma japonicum]